MDKIAFAGTDGRTLLWALVTATATSEHYDDRFEGIVVRGTPAMAPFAERMRWPVGFVPTVDNTVEGYTNAIDAAFAEGRIDGVVPMPEALLFDGLVDRLEAAGWGDRVIGLKQKAAFIEGDKIKCKQLCRVADIPVADAWEAVDAKDYPAVLGTCLDYIQHFGGAVLKYPYSAGGKGARIILNSWEIREVYDTLVKDYRDAYKTICGRKNNWPLLIESLMAGVEISFTVLVDRTGCYRILPTAMDYPERFEGPASKTNPITGGTGAVSPHPMETPALLEMAGTTIADPLIGTMKERGLLRPCVLYPGCFVSFDRFMQPVGIRVSEINIRPGEPEAQPVARRIRNLGALLRATLNADLARVAPEIRSDQVAVCTALMTGPGGPDGQKGYPWSCTKGEVVAMDHKYLQRKGLQLIPSAMTWEETDGIFKSDGTRVAFVNANATLKQDESRGRVAERLKNKILHAFDNGKIRVIPREDSAGNRLDIRRDIGRHYAAMEKLFPEAPSV